MHDKMKVKHKLSYRLHGEKGRFIMTNAKTLANEIMYFRSKRMLINMFNWNEKEKICDLMCCISYVMLMEGEY